MSTATHNYLTTQQAAEKVGVSARLIRQLIADGKLSSTLAGPMHLIPSDEVDALIEQRKDPRPVGYTMTLASAADKLGVPLSRLHKIVASGKVKSVKHKGQVYVNPSIRYCKA